MGSRRRLAVNTALLTAAALLMRCIGLAFQGWLSARIGAAGVGLYQLVLSVDFLCATFAISGIRFAATRLVSEELGCSRQGAVTGATARCLCYSLLFGLAACCVLYLCAGPIGFLWIGDARTVRPLRILAVSLPFLSLSSVMNGYFTAVGRVWKSASVQVTEQLVRIGLTVLLLQRAGTGNLERACAALAAGSAGAEICSFLLLGTVFLLDRRRHAARRERAPRLTGRMLAIALPLAVSAYARSALSTLEHLLVPRGLRACGWSADRALAGYGVIQGMALPVLVFPACVLTALAELIIPDLTAAQVAGRGGEIRRTVRRLLVRCFLFSCAAAAVLFAGGDFLGRTVFHSGEAGLYIRLLAPLVPVMYTDVVVDGCLKGLGQQLWSMGINIFDAAVGVLLVWQLLPLGGLQAYLAILYFGELLNFALSLWRLRCAVRGVSDRTAVFDRHAAG